MNVIYINHSGFLVETNESYYIFDYYNGDIPKLDKKKNVIVFSSHSHYDHFNPKIFEILENRGMKYEAVLSSDINKNNCPNNIKITTVKENMSYELDDGTIVNTLLSTDIGVAFLVKTNEGTIYHAGDLNDWYWEGELDTNNKKMTEKYRNEINKIKGEHIDVAFVPLDPRQEKHYSDGILYFLENVDCDIVYPMHYWNHPEIVDKFIKEYKKYKIKIRKGE